ncbi:MAG: hypothetical protein NVV68_13815 [Dokdonella sp.]|nr:hypothetical protein [Dokdonella sp.]
MSEPGGAVCCDVPPRVIGAMAGRHGGAARHGAFANAEAGDLVSGGWMPARRERYRAARARTGRARSLRV